MEMVNHKTRLKRIFVRFERVFVAILYTFRFALCYNNIMKYFSQWRNL